MVYPKSMGDVHHFPYEIIPFREQPPTAGSAQPPQHLWRLLGHINSKWIPTAFPHLAEVRGLGLQLPLEIGWKWMKLGLESMSLGMFAWDNFDCSLQESACRVFHENQPQMTTVGPEIRRHPGTIDCNFWLETPFPDPIFSTFVGSMLLFRRVEWPNQQHFMSGYSSNAVSSNNTKI